MQKIVKSAFRFRFTIILSCCFSILLYVGFSTRAAEVTAVESPVTFAQTVPGSAVLMNNVAETKSVFTPTSTSAGITQIYYEMEPNNTWDSIGTLFTNYGVYNEEHIGYVSGTNNDQDWHHFYLTQKSVISIVCFWLGNPYGLGFESDLSTTWYVDQQYYPNHNLVEVTSFQDVTFAQYPNYTGKKFVAYSGDYYLLIHPNLTHRSTYVGTPYKFVISIYDIEPPVITTQYYNAWQITNQNITVYAETNEGTLNAASHEFTENGSFDFVATDASGNVTTKTITITNIDKTIPVITIGNYTLDPINQPILVSATANEGTLNVASHLFTENGSFDFVATDVAGNVSTKTVTITNIVRRLPLIAGIENDHSYNYDLTLTFTEGSVTLDGASINSGVVLSAEGTYTIVTTDTLGFVDTIKVTIDKTSPILTISDYTTLPTNQWITVTASTNEGMLNSNKHIFNENGTFTFSAVDPAGNVSSREINITNIDTVAPIITIDPYRTTQTNQSITLHATTNEGTFITADTRVVTVNGEYNFVATDAAGNRTSKSVFITNLEMEAFDYGIFYSTHIQNVGWQGYKTHYEPSGTTNLGLRLEAIKIKIYNYAETANLGVRYSTHVQNIGWQDFVSDDAMSGTANRALRLEAIKIELTGSDADKYDVFYRVHAQNFGWLDFADNGRPAGTEGFGYRLEAIEITILPKLDHIGLPTARAFISSQGNQAVNYRTHVQNVGWQGFVGDGVASGTTGKALRLEGIEVKLGTGLPSGSILYSTHVQDIGWMDFVSDGTMSGTLGKAKRLEAIKIKLTGDIATKYDIYYRVHAENFGWLGWTSNGEPAGTANFAYRLEGIEIALIHKGAAAPGITYLPFVQKE